MCFIRGSLILKDRKRFVCNHDEGRAYLDGEIHYELGQTIQVRIAGCDRSNPHAGGDPNRVAVCGSTGHEGVLAESEHELMDELLTEPEETAPEEDEA